MRVRRRYVQPILLIALVAGGTFAYRRAAQPEPRMLTDLAQEALEEIFGPNVQHGAVSLDLINGVVIRDLSVPSGVHLARSEDGDVESLAGLSAKTVEIRHDVLLLAAGHYHPTSIRIDGAQVITHETESGIEPAFPFTLPSGHDGGEFPAVRISDALVYYRSLPGSTRLRGGAVLVCRLEELAVVPKPNGKVDIRGAFYTRELGQDDARVEIAGEATPDTGAFEFSAQWDPLELTDALLAKLDEDLAAKLEQDSIQSGKLVLRVTKEPPGEAKLVAEWDADVTVRMDDLPGLEEIEAETRQQLQELFGVGAVTVVVDGDRVIIKSFESKLADGRVIATGWIQPEDGSLELHFEIRDLRLEKHDAVKAALGAEGAAVFEEFDASGLVTAFGKVTRSTEGQLNWEVDVELEKASFRYLGAKNAAGKREGFPYRVSDATGWVRIREDGVYFDDITGFNRGAEITVLGFKHNKAWTGGETGRIRFSDVGEDIRLTVVATNMAVDERLREAVAGSEFAGLLDEFQLGGVIDKVEVDIISIPNVDTTAKTEVRLTLEGEQFRYAPFPLPLEDVRGEIMLRRPVLASGERGRIYSFEVSGWAEGSPIEVRAKIVDHEDRGRLEVIAESLPLAGEVTQTILTSEVTEGGVAEAWRWLDPRGRAHVRASLPIGQDGRPMVIHADLNEATVFLDATASDAPLELTKLTGRISVLGDDIHLVKLRGTMAGAGVRLEGALNGGTSGAWDIRIVTEPVRLTRDVERGLAHLAEDDELLPGGFRFEPGGQLGLDVHLVRKDGPDETLRADLTATKFDVGLRAPDGVVLQLRGKRLDVKDDMLLVEDVVAQLPGMTAEIPHARIPVPDESAEGEAPALEGQFGLKIERLEPNDAFLELLPDDVRDLLSEWAASRLISTEGLRVDAPKGGPVTLRGDLSFIVPPGEPVGDGVLGRLSFAPLVIADTAEGQTLKGLVRLEGFSMTEAVDLKDLEGDIHVERLVLGDNPSGSGRLAGISGLISDIRVRDLAAPLSWQDGIFRADPITGFVADGALQGKILVHTRAPVAYEGQARVDQFDVARLAEDLAPTGAPYKGIGTAHVTFQNRGGTLRDLTAAGAVHVRRGALGDLPFVANIFALADRVFDTDDPPKFERADVEFVLKDEVFELQRIDLAGPLFEMPGSGTLDLAGVIDLRFTPDFIKSMAVPGMMQMPVVGDVVGGILREELLYAVRVRGDLSSADPEIVLFPLLGVEFGPSFEGTGAPKLPKRRLPKWFR